MFQTSGQVVSWINDRLKLGIKPGLNRMEWLMEKLDHPERELRTVHIAGTNGKGSTTTFLRSILQEAGYEIGTFTSPYFEKFNERISVNGIPIADEDLINAANTLKPYFDELEQTEWGAPTEFEIITALGFYYFARIHRVDLVVVEVGLGGRLDSTNIITPLVSVITSIGYDHMNILGNTLGEIAAEKAGIIKNGIPVITGVKNPEALDVIVKIANSRKANVYMLDNHFTVQDFGPENSREVFAFQSIFQNFPKLELSMLGYHQIQNASLSVMAAIYLKTYFSFHIEEKQVKQGLLKAYWPGRFEIIRKNPTVILDGAHNQEGLESLLNTIDRHYPNGKGTIMFTALRDKPLESMIQLLDQSGYNLAFTEFEFKRASKAEDLAKLSNSSQLIETVEDWKQYILEKLERMPENELLIITGSLYFISEVKPFLSNFT